MKFVDTLRISEGISVLKAVHVQNYVFNFFSISCSRFNSFQFIKLLKYGNCKPLKKQETIPLAHYHLISIDIPHLVRVRLSRHVKQVSKSLAVRLSQPISVELNLE